MPRERKYSKPSAMRSKPFWSARREMLARSVPSASTGRPKAFCRAALQAALPERSEALNGAGMKPSFSGLHSS